MKQGPGTVVKHLERGSTAELVSRKLRDKLDYHGFYRALSLAQRAETLSALQSLAFVHAGILKSIVSTSTQRLVAEMAKVPFEQIFVRSPKRTSGLLTRAMRTLACEN